MEEWPHATCYKLDMITNKFESQELHSDRMKKYTGLLMAVFLTRANPEATTLERSLYVASYNLPEIWNWFARLINHDVPTGGVFPPITGHLLIQVLEVSAYSLSQPPEAGGWRLRAAVP
jgi:hypothetical protein